jgi:hypothetical protein
MIDYVERLKDLEGTKGSTVYVNEILEDLEDLGVRVTQADEAGRTLPDTQFGNPEKMSALELLQNNLDFQFTNYSYYLDDDEDMVKRMMRALERTAGATQPLQGVKRTGAEHAQEANRILRTFGSFK